MRTAFREKKGSLRAWRDFSKFRKPGVGMSPKEREFAEIVVAVAVTIFGLVALLSAVCGALR